MRHRALVFALSCWVLVALPLAGCGSDGGSDNPDGGDTPTADTPGGDAPTGDVPGNDTPPPPPIMSSCESLPLVDMTGATEVADENSLRAAAEAGGLVQLTTSITVTAPINVTAETVIDLGGHAVSGGETTHIFTASRTDFTIQNGVLLDGNNQVSDNEHFSQRSGAAVRQSGGGGGETPVGSLTVIDVHFRNNRIKSEGPGDLRGGALYAFNLPDVTISGSSFTDNFGSNGGAVGGLGASFEIIDTVFVNNHTNGTGPAGALEGHGGAISLDAVSQNGQTAYFRVCGSEFTGNTSEHGGGAIYLVTHWYTGTEFVIDQSVFSGNQSVGSENGQGGAIFLMDDDKHEQRTQTRNSAQISNTLFVGNQTLGSGGGVWFWTNEGRLTVTNTTFVDNQVYTDGNGMGGAVAISQGPADFVHCTFANNWAKFHGGAIQMGGDANVSMKNSLFVNNTSNRDGGWANFHTNREVDNDLGGNMQWLEPELEIDSNSNKPVSANAAFANPTILDLEENGGPTMTMALPAGSPAVDAGVADDPIATDGRGEPRDATPDVGAYELQP